MHGTALGSSDGEVPGAPPTKGLGFNATSTHQENDAEM